MGANTFELNFGEYRFSDNPRIDLIFPRRWGEDEVLLMLQGAYVSFRYDRGAMLYAMVQTHEERVVFPFCTPLAETQIVNELICQDGIIYTRRYDDRLGYPDMVIELFLGKPLGTVHMTQQNGRDRVMFSAPNGTLYFDFTLGSLVAIEMTEYGLENTLLIAPGRDPSRKEPNLMALWQEEEFRKDPVARTENDMWAELFKIPGRTTQLSPHFISEVRGRYVTLDQYINSAARLA